MSSVDNIYISQSVIDAGLNRGKKVFCALIDFSTALNINRNCLWYKLPNSGPRGHKCNIFFEYLDSALAPWGFQGITEGVFA